MALSALMCAAVGWGVYDVGMNLVVWHFIQETSQGDPSLSVVPTTPPDASIAALHGLQIRNFEYSFQVPWDDLAFERDHKSATVRYFKNGATLMLFDPTTELNRTELLRGKSQEDQKKIKRVLGIRPLSSNYDLLAAELATASSQVKWWSPLAVKARGFLLLNLKSMEILKPNAIYMQSNGEMHGFQLGNPALPPYQVELNLFDTNDRRYKMLIAGKQLTHQVMTQAEVNAMVASLKPIPHS